ncbi:MAG: polysaccharide deacetylase family protein [Acidobacteriota bacterium]|nr:polysaccharide deacetylase family protein [Acidobacteriota bacterium]
MDQRLAVLLYHNVGPRLPGTNRWLTVSSATFRRHVETLARNGYTGITARQWLDHLRGQGELPPKPVLLTFDDGYAAIAEHALPVLREHGFSATVFIVTGLIGKADAWEDAEGPMRMTLLRADEVRRWAGQGIEFGAHSRTHPDLRKLHGQDLRQEIAGSRADLEKLVGREPCAFAYPFGFQNAEVRTAVAEAFPLGFTTRAGMNERNTDPLQLCRSRVWPLDSTLDIRFRAARGWAPFTGVLSLAAALRNRVLGRGVADEK